MLPYKSILTFYNRNPAFLYQTCTTRDIAVYHDVNHFDENLYFAEELLLESI